MGFESNLRLQFRLIDGTFPPSNIRHQASITSADAQGIHSLTGITHAMRTKTDPMKDESAMYFGFLVVTARYTRRAYACKESGRSDMG